MTESSICHHPRPHSDQSSPKEHEAYPLPLKHICRNLCLGWLSFWSNWTLLGESLCMHATRNFCICLESPVTKWFSRYFYPSPTVYLLQPRSPCPSKTDIRIYSCTVHLPCKARSKSLQIDFGQVESSLQVQLLLGWELPPTSQHPISLCSDLLSNQLWHPP